MRNFQKRGWKNIFESKPVLGVLFLLVLVFAWGVLGFLGKMYDTRENRKISENRLRELTAEKDRLSNEIASLKTDKGVEESIRDKFGLGKDGEELIIVVDDETKTEPVVQEESWFTSFWHKLFK